MHSEEIGLPRLFIFTFTFTFFTLTFTCKKIIRRGWGVITIGGIVTGVELRNCYRGIRRRVLGSHSLFKELVKSHIIISESFTNVFQQVFHWTLSSKPIS